MKTRIAHLVVGLVLGACTVPVWAKTETITGEVISVRCYLERKTNVGKAGFVCAWGDVKWEGNPPGLLTADGKVYQLAGDLVAGNNAKVVPHLGHTVTITGDVAEKEGMLILTASDLKMAGGLENAEVKLDRPLARVLAVTIQPHQPSAPQAGSTDRVVVFRDPGQITLTAAGKTERLDFKSGDVRWLAAGVSHGIENTTDRPIETVVIELKNTPRVPPLVLTPLDPPVADSTHYKVSFENDRTRVLRVSYGPHEKGGLHQHIRERVVINLSPQLRARFGDVTMVGEGTHSEENDTDMPEDKVAVELK